jgi:uncharacterized DUF497 family protein
MDIEWNDHKNSTNFDEHGLRFEDAALVFTSQTITFEDNRENYREIRYITLGLLAERVVILVHTIRDNRIRIISMRKANEREKKIYYERLKEN